MFQWNAVDTSPDFGGQNVLKTFAVAIRQNRRTTRTKLKFSLTGLFFSLAFKNIPLSLLRGAIALIAPPPIDPLLRATHAACVTACCSLVFRSCQKPTRRRLTVRRKRWRVSALFIQRSRRLCCFPLRFADSLGFAEAFSCSSFYVSLQNNSDNRNISSSFCYRQQFLQSNLSRL